MRKEALIITIGPPGSGKSTWADEHVPPTMLRLERDRFRECLFGSRRAYHESVYSRSQLSEVVTNAMLSAMQFWPTPSYAVTDTGLQYKAVKPFIKHAQRIQLPVLFFVFERDRKLLMERNHTRPSEQRIPEHILVDMINLFEDQDAWWRKLPSHLVQHVSQGGKP